ncbi:hypothetical protein [Bdellovibrio sp. HCB209]|uniref:hypothetical protein n=1 Tax=Bdellovibrio sp. HCB209 TaxID=3394354 RepID=UPI0039B61AFD
MNFFVSMLVVSIVVFQAVKWAGPLPEKINSKINTQMSDRQRNLQAALMADYNPPAAYSPEPLVAAIAVAPSPIYPVATPVRRWGDIKHTNKPLMTFERYIAKQKKIKKQKRAVASVAAPNSKKKIKAKKYQVKKPAIKRNQKVASGVTRV